MPSARPPRPTDSELAILRVLWKRGPSTVRQVMDDPAVPAKTGYTTILKFLQIMTEKRLVRRKQNQRTHIYEAALTEEATQQQLVRHLLDRAFGGSAKKLVMQALSTQKTSPDELKQIRELLDTIEGGQP